MSERSGRRRHDLRTAALILLGAVCGAACVLLLPRLFDERVSSGVIGVCASAGIACVLLLAVAGREARRLDRPSP